MNGVKLSDITAYLDGYFDIANFPDFGGAHNGLQFENSGRVHRVACAVDAGLREIEAAAESGADLLIVHHGLYWDIPVPVVAHNYKKIKTLVQADIAVYAMHLPLDAHPKIGNNALIADALGLKVIGRCFPHEGHDIGAMVEPPKGGRAELEKRLQKIFPQTYKACAFGSESPEKIAVCSGSCGDVVAFLKSVGTDTLICGELRQRHYVMAQEMGLNLYPCGHCATERFGAQALGKMVGEKFALPCSFIKSDNPL